MANKCVLYGHFQVMNFQIVPAAGLIPQAAMPIYGAPASSPLLGQVVGAGGLIGPRPGQLSLLAAQGGGSQASQAALLQGIRQPLGRRRQPVDKQCCQERQLPVQD